MHTVDPELIMQMRASSESAFANITDDLPLFNATASLYFAPELGQVAVYRGVFIASVLDENNASITAFPAAVNDFSVAGAFNWSTGRGGIIYAFMHPHLVQYGVASVAEF